MECVIRFAQSHETFRQAEIEALASLAGVDVELYSKIKDQSFNEQVLTRTSRHSASPNSLIWRQLAK